MIQPVLQNDYAVDLQGEQKQQFEDLGVKEDLRIAMNRDYKINDIIGIGAFGFVVKGECRHTETEVAMKVMIN